MSQFTVMQLLCYGIMVNTTSDIYIYIYIDRWTVRGGMMCNIIVFNFDTLAQIIFIVKSFMIYNTYNAVSSYIHIAESMVWHANPENRNASLRSCFAAPYILREKKSYSLLWSFCLSNVLSYQEWTGGMPGRIDSCKLCCADYFNFSLTTQSTNILYIYIYMNA